MKPAVTSFSYFTSHKMSLVRPGSHPTGRVIQAGGEGPAEALYSESTKNLIFKKSSAKFCHITFTRFSSIGHLFNMHLVNSSKTVFCRKKSSFGISSLTGAWQKSLGYGWALDTVGWSIAFQKKRLKLQPNNRTLGDSKVVGNGKQIVESRWLIGLPIVPIAAVPSVVA